MDVKALLQQSPELNEEDIADSLQFGSNLVCQDENSSEKEISDLYCAYNGIMAGLFVGASLFFDARKELELRQHTIECILGFLLTYNNQFKQNATTLSDYDNIEDAIEHELRDHDNTIAEYYLLGLALFRYVLLRDISEENENDAEEVKRLLAELGHPPLILEKTTERIRKSYLKGDPTWQDMMSTCVRFVRELISNIDEEKDTCFVALPFKEPYLERYLNFYRAIAQKMKMLPIRAWGGLGNEDHQEMLFTLVAKSGALLADVTEPNANVSMEVGFALGQNKKVWLVAEGSNWKNISNVKLDWVFPYEVPNDEYWAFEQAERAGLYFTMLDAAKRPGPVPSWRFDVMEILNEVAGIFKDIAKNKKD